MQKSVRRVKSSSRRNFLKGVTAILSRKYSEMKLANLAAAGESLKEIGV
jgi:hypothetical protein